MTLIDPDSGGSGTVLTADSCAGTVWAQACKFEGGGSSPGVLALQSDAVILTRCRIQGADGVFPLFGEGGPAKPALRVVQSQVYAYDSLVQGADGVGGGGCATFTCGEAIGSGAAAAVLSGLLFSSASVFAGGDGGDGLVGCENFGAGGNGADGASALLLLGEDAHVETYATDFIGGPGGGAGTSCSGGASPPVIDLVAGTIAETPGTARRLVFPTPLVEGDPYRLDVLGAPGDLVIAGLGLTPGAPVVIPPGIGPLHLALPLNLVTLGAIPASGRLAIQTHASQVAAEGLGRFSIQLLFVTPLAEAFLGGPATLVVADSAL